MRKLATILATLGVLGGFVLGTAVPATAATSGEKPVVSIGELEIWASGAVTPDSWRHYVKVPLFGSRFTPGGAVYITFQDITAGTPALSNGQWITAGNGFCGVECNNYGKFSYSRTLNYPYGSICGHYIRAWAWDDVKSPAGHGWSYADKRVVC
jgi:hypothetical protein